MASTIATRIARKVFGLKNLADYAESRRSLLGVANLSIKTVVDVGANRGRLTRAFRRQFPDARIIAVEPIPKLAQDLSRWASKQRGAVDVVQAALSNEPGESTFYVCRSASIWSSLGAPAAGHEDAFEPIPVRVETLDNLAKQANLGDNLLLKIDTEGFDMEVIHGGRETLARTAAIIIESTYFPTLYGDDAPIFEEIVKELWDLGFCFRGNVRCGWKNGVCFGADALFVRRSEAHRLAA